MIVHNFKKCKGFIICYGMQSPGESYISKNIADGDFNNIAYLLSGKACVGNVDTIDRINTQMIKGTMADMTPYAGAAIISKNTDGFNSWICINPLPASKRYEARLINGPSTEVITGDGKEMFVICFEGSITCNGIEMKQMEYTRILKNNIRTISVSERSAAGVFIRSDSINSKTYELSSTVKEGLIMSDYTGKIK